MTMTDWTAGYVADIGYTYGYYTELNPLRMKLAFLNNGLVFPNIGTACELGFGQGLSTNIHAAATITKWFGTDFNPAQASFAKELANASGAKVSLYDDAFADFASRNDLPDFDYIGLHGIWSWISDENRHTLVDFIRRKLKVGGVLYISYNTLPGWAGFAPMRHLMNEHAKILGSEGNGIVNRIDGAMEFAGNLLETNPAFSRANPLIADRLKTMKAYDRHYLAHEYFNRDWHPMHFSTMAEWLDGAKVQYACSAHYIDHIDSINLSAEQLTFLNEISNPMFRETVRDFMVNQQFRRDYWVKGARKISPLERAEQLRQIKVLLISHRSDITLKVTAALGEATMNETIYGIILDTLDDYTVKSLGEIETAVKSKGVVFSQILEAAMLLNAAGNLVLAQEEDEIATVQNQADSLNAYICKKARSSNEISYLASPVSGGGITVNRFQQLFLMSIAQGQNQPEEWAKFVWTTLSGQGQKLVKEGLTLETEEENLSELISQANTFADKQLAILKALKITR